MKKITKIIIGTHNKGKFSELSSLLPKRLKKLSPEKLKIKSPKETGKSFKSNSKLKAIYFFKKTNITSISDDSGLCIDRFKNKPGIYSARWAKQHGGFQAAMGHIIKILEKKNRIRKNTKAKFVCSLTIQLNNKKSITVQGEIKGNISPSVIGNKGFGYDSIFIPNGYKITFGQMTKKKKLFLDHRYIAYKKLKKKLLLNKTFF